MSYAVMAVLLTAVAFGPLAAYAVETVGVEGHTFLFVPGDSIKIMDVTMPYTPLEVASIPVSSWHMSHIAIDGGSYLAAMGADGALRILDLAVPYVPVEASALPLPNLDAASVSDVDWARSGDSTFVMVSAGDRLEIIDVTDPQNPSRMGEIRNGDWRINALDEVRDSEPFWAQQAPYVLVAGPDAVQIVDFADAASPVGVSAIRQGQYGFGTVGGLLDIDVAELEGGLYALILGQHSFMVADITDPSAPAHMGTIGYTNLIDMDVVTAGDASYALLMCIDKVHIIDISDPRHPTAVSTVPITTADVAGIESEGRIWVLSVGDGIEALDITNPASPIPSYAREGGFSYAPEATDIAVIDGKIYALTASTGHSTIQITEITDADNPVSASAVVGGQHSHKTIYGPHDVAVAEMGGKTYAVVPNIYGDSLTVLDVADPYNPRISSVLELPALRAPTSATIIDIGSSTYAAVTGFYSEAIQLVNITEPESPSPGVLIMDEQYGFEAVGDPLSVDAVTIDGSPYILVASYYDSMVQVIDVSDPASPTPAAAVSDGAGGHVLGGAHDIKAVHIGDRAFAVVAAAYESSVSIMDITDPTSPVAVSHVTDGHGGFEYLDTVQYLETVQHGDRTLVLATSYFDNAVQMMDITNPLSPEPLPSAAVSMDGFGALVGPEDISAVRHATGTYVVVADYFGNGIQIARISDDPALEAASVVAAGLDESLPLAVTPGVALAAINDKTYALTAAHAHDSVQVTDITDSGAPIPVSLMRGGEEGFVMDGPVSIAVGEISGGHYAFVGGLWSDSIQVVDVSDPAMPEPVSLIQGDLNWIVEIEFLHVSGAPYLAAVTRTGDVLHMIDVSDPAMPERVVSLPGVVASVQGLDMIHTAERTLALVYSFDNSAMNILDITTPSNPRQIYSMPDGEYLYSVTDAGSITVGDRTLTAVSSYRTDRVSILDITNPLNPVILSSVRGNDGGHFLHGPESVQVLAIGDGVFAAVANGNDSLQLMDITDPYNPVLAASTGTAYDSAVYGVTDVEVLQAGGSAYVAFQTIDPNTTLLLDVTDPYEPTASVIPPIHHLPSFR